MSAFSVVVHAYARRAPVRGVVGGNTTVFPKQLLLTSYPAAVALLYGQAVPARPWGGPRTQGPTRALWREGRMDSEQSE